MFSFIKNPLKFIIEDDTIEYEDLDQKTNTEVFMENHNILKLTGKIYDLSKYFNSKLSYLYFKESLPSLMFSWARVNKINDLYMRGNETYSTYDKQEILEYINNKFIKDHEYIYNPYFLNPNYENTHLANSNVFHSPINIYTIDDETNKLVTDKKDPRELMPEDIRNLDVWENQQISLQYNYFKRDNIPLWQKRAHTRNHSREDEGYTYKLENSSYVNNIYKNSDMDKLLELKKAKNKKDF